MIHLSTLARKLVKKKIFNCEYSDYKLMGYPNEDSIYEWVKKYFLEFNNSVAINIISDKICSLFRGKLTNIRKLKINIAYFNNCESFQFINQYCEFDNCFYIQNAGDESSSIIINKKEFPTCRYQIFYIMPSKECCEYYIFMTEFDQANNEIDIIRFTCSNNNLVHGFLYKKWYTDTYIKYGQKNYPALLYLLRSKEKIGENVNIIYDQVCNYMMGVEKKQIYFYEEYMNIIKYYMSQNMQKLDELYRNKIKKIEKNNGSDLLHDDLVNKITSSTRKTIDNRSSRWNILVVDISILERGRSKKTLVELISKNIRNILKDNVYPYIKNKYGEDVVKFLEVGKIAFTNSLILEIIFQYKGDNADYYKDRY